MCGVIRGSDYSLVQRLAWQNRLESEETEVTSSESGLAYLSMLRPHFLLPQFPQTPADSATLAAAPSCSLSRESPRTYSWSGKKKFYVNITS